MCEENRFVKRDPAAAHPRGQGNPGQRRHPAQFLLGKGQGHERRARFNQRQAKAFGQLIAKPRGPHLGNGFAAGRDNHRGRTHLSAGSFNRKARSLAPHGTQGARHPQLAPGSRKIARQQRHNILGRAITEKLTQGLLVPSNPRRIQACDEIPLGVAFQRRQRKARIFRQESVRRNAKVGKVAPPTARDADLLTRPRGVIDHQHPTPAPSGLYARHQACSPCAQNDHIHLFHAPRIAAKARSGNHAPPHPNRRMFLRNPSCTPQNPSLNTAARLGRRQVVRHRFLVPTYLGSNPSAPANLSPARR